ncbi:MAG: hypothetical protein QW660_02870 [Candidatus Bathyarchaeia archaeon]
METGKILYFDAPGPQNTDDVVAIVKERIEKGDVRHVIVCSVTGKTALKMAEAVKDFGVHICCVSGAASWQIHGYKWPLIGGSIRRKLEELKVDIVERTLSTLSGDTIDYGLARYGWVPASWIVAETLEAVGGYGLKTAVEGGLGCNRLRHCDTLHQRDFRCRNRQRSRYSHIGKVNILSVHVQPRPKQKVSNPRNPRDAKEQKMAQSNRRRRISRKRNNIKIPQNIMSLKITAS